MPNIEVKVFLETPSSVFDCILGVEDIDSEMETLHEYDVFIALDCTRDRLGDAEPVFNIAKKKINIDHHVSNQGCGDINIVVPDAGSTCEVVYELLDLEKINEEIIHTVSEGDGPVNALDMALRKALKEIYPIINKFKLADFKVRILDSKEGTGARTRVHVETTDGFNRWDTVGVSCNITEAAYMALVDSILFGLLINAVPALNEGEKICWIKSN